VNEKKSVNIGKDTCKSVVVSCSLLKDEESARDNHVLAGNFAKYSPILIFFSRTDTSVGWQVTLRDPIWHVSSPSGVAG